jgi:hypothetical protein
MLTLVAPVLFHSRLLAQAQDDKSGLRAVLKPSPALAATVLPKPSSSLSASYATDLFEPASRGEISLPIRPPVRFPIRPAPVGLAQITRAAGTIFMGTVISIMPGRKSSTDSLESVAINFHVERSLRGTHAGQQLTIVQWMGAWRSGQRFHVGEHVLLFLYPPSKLGLTSSVAGPLGRFSVDALGRVIFSESQLAAFRAVGGKLRVSLDDFARSVQRISTEDGALR